MQLLKRNGTTRAARIRGGTHMVPEVGVVEAPLLEPSAVIVFLIRIGYIL